MTVATVWTANTAKSLNNIVCPTNGVDGMFFRVTTAGTTGAGEPSWTKIIGQSVYDGTVVYEAFSSIFNDLSKQNSIMISKRGVKIWEITKDYSNSTFPNDETSIGSFAVFEDALGDTYLRFTPLPDAYNTDYDLKVVRQNFNDQTGVGTFGVGFVNITGSVGIATTVSSGITTTRVIGLSSEKYHSLHLQNHILNQTTNEQNYVELYVTHDGQNTYTSEYFVDTHSDVGMYSDILMGEFVVGFSTDSGHGNELIVDYHNDSTDKIELKTRIVGFGSTAVGVGTYRYLAPGQPAGSEQTALYQSDYSIGTGTTTVFSILNTDFNAVKSVVEVSAGSTRALHQVYTMHDGGDVYTQPSPFISVGSTSISDSLSGLGSFNGKYNGNQLQLEFIPDSAYASTEIQVA